MVASAPQIKLHIYSFVALCTVFVDRRLYFIDFDIAFFGRERGRRSTRAYYLLLPYYTYSTVLY